MSIIKKKTWAIIVLVSFMLTLLPMPAMADSAVTWSNSNKEWVEAESHEVGTPATIELAVKNIGDKAETLTIDLSALKDYLKPETYRTNSNSKEIQITKDTFTVTVKKGTWAEKYSDDRIFIKAIIGPKAGEKTGDIIVSSGTHQLLKRSVTLKINTGVVVQNQSNLSYTYIPIDAANKTPSASVVINLKDSNGNPSQDLAADEYLWVWGDSELSFSNWEGTGTNPPATENDKYKITPSASTVTFKVSGNAEYNLHWCIGKTTSGSETKKINLEKVRLIIKNSNDEKLTTHASPDKRSGGDGPTAINYALLEAKTGKYYLELPVGFTAEGEMEITEYGADKPIKVIEIQPSQVGGGNTIKITAVPEYKEAVYREYSTEDPDNLNTIVKGFKLFYQTTQDKADGSGKETIYLEHKFVDKECEITVAAKTLEGKEQIIISNSEEFRYATGGAPTNPKVSFNLKGWKSPFEAGDYTMRVITTTGSELQIGLSAPTGRLKDGREYKDVPFGKNGLSKIEVPVEIKGEPKNPITNSETIPFDIEIYNINHGIYAKGQVALIHKVTGEMLKVGEIEIGKPSSPEEVPYVNGETYNRTIVPITLPDKPLNGNKLFVWIEDVSGEKKDIKEYFAVDVEPKDKLESYNSNVGPGTAITGSSNVFEIRNPDDEDNLGVTQFNLVIWSQKPGKFKVHVAIAKNAQGITEDKIGNEGFEFIDTKDKPVITLQNDGIIYGGESIKGAGTVKYTIENTTWKQGDTITLQLPPKYHPEFAITSSQALKVSIPIKLGQPGKDNIFKGTFKLDYAPQPSGNTEVDNFEGWTMLSPENKPADIKFEGGLTITKRAEEAEVLVDIVTGKGFSGDGVAKLLINTDAAGEIVLKDQKSLVGGKLQNKVLLVWLEKDDKLVKDNKHLTITDTKNYTTSDGKAEGFDEGSILIKWNAEAITGNTMEIPFAMVQFTDKEVGNYKIKAELREIDNTDPQKPQYRPVDKGDGEKSFKVVTTLTDTEWSLAIKLNGDTLSGDNSGVFKSDELALNTKLELEVQLKDKDGNALAEKEVEVSVNKSSLKLTPEKGKTDSNGKVTFTGTPETTTDLDYIVTIKAFEDKDTMATATVTIPIRVEPNNDKDDSNVDTDNLDLQIKGMTDVVARGKTASIYIEAYDDDDDLVKVTSDAMAEKIIDRVRLIDTPTSSDLRSSDVYFKRSGDGIVVYFYPDVTGYYEVRIEGAGNDPTVLTPEITAIRQNDKIVRMELEYNETTLGIGRRSSPAIIYTYDEDGNKAQRSLLDSRLEITSSGSAVENLSPMGVVSVKNSDRYAGQTIRVMVVDERNNLTAEWVFNVDEYSSSGDKNNDDLTNVKDIVLWDNYGGVGMTNRIQFYLTDESGFRTILEPGQLSSGNNASATVSIASKPAGATVTASIYNNGRTLEDDGYGYLDVYSSKEGIVRLNLTFKVYNPEDSTNSWKRYDYYRKTVEIHMTKNITSSNIGYNWADIGNGNNNSSSAKNNKHDISVAMFVGSPIYTVNMLQKEMDTSPYIDGGRTYIPIRTLSDSLGALTNYDSKDQKITIVYGAERVEMQIGSNIVTTTRKGSYRTDVAPVIQDGRTMIPLRTAAEALGCDVEAVTDQYGSTLGAVFSK